MSDVQPRGLLLDFEGIDGSGKGTQAQRLHARLTSERFRCALISFPRYSETLFGRAVGDFLNGRFGSLEQVHPFLVSLLFAGDRFESKGLLCDALAQHDVVVLDRYVPSNIAHQAAKLTGTEREELIRRILEIEHAIFGLPRADLVLHLDLPVPQAQALIARKCSAITPARRPTSRRRMPVTSPMWPRCTTPSRGRNPSGAASTAVRPGTC